MGGKLLVVDDDAVVRHWLSETLGASGHQVIECDGGHKALALIRDEQPDLVLIDVEMPGMGGREVCRIIKGGKGFGFVPIILMTARDDIQTKVEGLELGADDYLIKPLNPLELEARVKSMLRLKQLQDELLRANERLRSINEHLQDLSTTDSLMGIHNRMYFNKRISYEFHRASRYRQPFSLMILDLDHFKQVNDTHGHPFGDLVLKGFADLLISTLRQVDIVARYGGEEIVVILPETDRAGTDIVAERLRETVEKKEIGDHTATIHITVSIGFACFPGDGIEKVEDLIKKADDALYEAKHAGRNCVRFAS